MNFGQLIEYNTGNTFLVKSYTKCGGKASLKPFYKISKLNISLNQQSEMVKVCFYCNSKSKSTKIYKNEGAEDLL